MVRRFRFRTRTLLAICTIMAIGLGLASMRISDRAKQRRIADDLKSRGWDFSIGQQDVFDYILNGYVVESIFQREPSPPTDFKSHEMAALNYVKRIDMQSTAINEDDLAAISQMTRLVTLDLSGTKITSPMARQLCKMTQLKHLYLYGVDISAHDLTLIKSELPQTMIRWTDSI